MTERAQNADFRRKPQIFADSPLLLQIQAFGGRRKPQKTADLHREPKIFAENRRKPQFGLRHLRCVTFSSALEVSRARNPKRVQKESERVSQRLWPSGAPESPKSAPWSPKRVQKESEAVFLDSFRTAGRTLWGLWGSRGPEALGHPFGLFSDSFRVPGPGRPLCQAGGFPNPCCCFMEEERKEKPREASTLILKIRSCIARIDLKNKAYSSHALLIAKIRSWIVIKSCSKSDRKWLTIPVFLNPLFGELAVCTPNSRGPWLP